MSDFTQAHNQAEIDAYQQGQRDMRERLLRVARSKVGLWDAAALAEFVEAATVGVPPPVCREKTTTLFDGVKVCTLVRGHKGAHGDREGWTWF